MSEKQLQRSSSDALIGYLICGGGLQLVGAWLLGIGLEDDAVGVTLLGIGVVLIGSVLTLIGVIAIGVALGMRAHRRDSA